LLESVYELVLARVLEQRGFAVYRQHAVSFEYEGMTFPNAFRIDLLVDRCVAVELKSVERLSPVHAKQLLTYLRLADLRVGLLINIGDAKLKDGLRRVVNDMPFSASPRLRVNRSSPP
jgi:GxxExxY protein